MQFKTIIAASLLSLASAQTVANPEPAAAIYDNPVGKVYSATFDGSKGVTGKLTFQAGSGGKGVDISVQLKGFVGEPGPFGYHIHDQPVPADGNCTATKAHLDPYGRGQATPCDPSQPQTCEVGDLAGKHGKIPASSYGPVDFAAKYNDLYASTKPGIGAFLGNRSIVIHRNDEAKSRLACVNIVFDEECSSSATVPSATGPHSVPVGTGSPAPGSTGSPYYPGNNGTNTTTTSSPAPPAESVYTGSAASFGINSMVAVGGLVAGMMMAL
ncbi:superoxide dismutase [Sphaerosporella brunnea]|uniref:superoxide dismutase n=1 Tax=Sphaerosporella brunnea TaxID=1250544 RepID=A0A5J5F8V7_9PEZI|nr:superoxide dismutase [Sphaerosporella brunnea]